MPVSSRGQECDKWMAVVANKPTGLNNKDCSVHWTSQYQRGCFRRCIISQIAKDCGGIGNEETEKRPFSGSQREEHPRVHFFFFNEMSLIVLLLSVEIHGGRRTKTEIWQSRTQVKKDGSRPQEEGLNRPSGSSGKEECEWMRIDWKGLDGEKRPGLLVL